jgi:hypothetical protein
MTPQIKITAETARKALGLPHGDDPGCVAPALRSLKLRLNNSAWSSNQARAKGLRRLAVAQLGSKDHLDEKEFARRLVDHAIRRSAPQALRSAASVITDETHKAALRAAADRCEKEGTREAALEAKGVALATYATYSADNDEAAPAYAAAAAANHAAVAAAYATAACATYSADNYEAAPAYAAAAYAAAANHAAAASTSTAAAMHSSAAYATADAAAYAAYATAFADKDLVRDKFLADYAEAVVQILIDMKAPGCQWLPLTEAA